MDCLSVILPACNEARRLPGLLHALLREKGLQLEVIVVANGCSDDTAHLARGFQVAAKSNGHVLKVVETNIASKATALNLGEKATDIFPRIFMDADIIPSNGALRSVIDALGSNPGKLVAPRVKFQSLVGPVSALIGPFLSELPPFHGDVVGAGFYATDQDGRARWNSFPDLFADDAFVCGLFSPEERIQLTDCFFEARFPPDRDLFGVILRWNLGRMHLKQAGYSVGTKSRKKVSDVAKPILRFPLAASAWFCLVIAAKTAAGLQLFFGIKPRWFRASD